jgi:hypothetical protein
MQRDQLSIEEEAEEWIKKKEAEKPPAKFKFSKYRILLFHFYILYFMLFVLSISTFYGLVLGGC